MKMLDGAGMLPHNRPMDAIVTGHVCIDLTPGLHLHHPVRTVSEMIRPGCLLDVSGLTVSPGGAVSNTGLSLARMGVAVGLIGRVGTDSLAQMLRQELAVAGAHAQTELVQDGSAGTSYSVILPIPGVDRIFLHDSGANDNFSVQDLVHGLSRLGGATPGDAAPRLMHFGYPTAVASMYRDGPAPLRELLSAARERGMTVSVDFSLPDPEGEAAAAPWREILAEAMPLTDLCFPSIEELSLMIDPAGFAERERTGAGAQSFSCDYAYLLAGELVTMGAAVVVVKLGGRGLLLRWDPMAGERLQDTGAIDLAERLPAAGPGGSAGPDGLPSGGPVGLGARAGHAEPAVPPPACSARSRDLDDSATPADTAIDALLVPSYPVEQVVSATGAGDTAIAGFLAALLAGGSILDAAETGCVAGRNAVTTVDAVSSVQPLAVMEQFRRTASHRSEVTIEDDSAWQRRTDGAFEHRAPTGMTTDTDMTTRRRRV